MRDMSACGRSREWESLVKHCMSASSVSAPKHGCAPAAGLFRVRGFTQDDAHIFCLPEQIAGEIVGVLALVEEVMGAFGFKEFEVRWQGKSFHV